MPKTRYIGHEIIHAGFRLDPRRRLRCIEELAEKIRPAKLNPRDFKLAVGQRQRVEIVKALYRGAALLVLDEPTAVLTPQEVDDVLPVFPADGSRCAMH